MNQECALVCTEYFVRLTPAGNSQINLGKSRDEFKSEMKQGTWWTPITLHKEGRWKHYMNNEWSGRSNKVSKIKEKKDDMTKGWKRKECNLGNKKLMNSSSYETRRTRKTSSKREGPSRVIYPSTYGVITLQWQR